LHCRVWSCPSKLYRISALGGVNRGVIGFGFGVEESPNTSSTSTIVVNKLIMIANPNRNDVAFKFFNFITVTLWCCVLK
jgi:hypothetical protein